MRDLDWFKKNIAPYLVDYEIQYSFFNKGDFGSLSSITFESYKKGGYIHFWGSGWLGVDVVDYETGEEILNVLLEEHSAKEQDELLEKLKKILLLDME
ncbi:hypothetical protein [uncultured Bacteroides sp.]|uniref:hypothetical protein n=1 Tax=uncultured Bacteroides sp. TaxID=162156 RepID=UPI0023CF1441|nr:hypothetical protein [uncultured Bacteroides sp.]MDE5701622.1 hypothetical protein [Bacteroides sp.]MDE6173737.1 hypothetical protein [Bacteroides sp.]